jgi:hypothetical protein
MNTNFIIWLIKKHPTIFWTYCTPITFTITLLTQIYFGYTDIPIILFSSFLTTILIYLIPILIIFLIYIILETYNLLSTYKNDIKTEWKKDMYKKYKERKEK